MDIDSDFMQQILCLNFKYIVIETEYTSHHIERTGYQDRGRIKWIAETKPGAFRHMDNHVDEACRSYIDSGDLFPRLYFLGQSFLMEFEAWLKARDLTITNIKKGEV